MNITTNINNSNNSTFYSLNNVENYKTALNYIVNDILNKHNLLIIEYFRFITEKVNLKNNACNKFIIIRGLETVSHVFNNILYYTKNVDMAFYHGQKAFYFYVEFIEQISDDQHTFLQLNSRDASMFVYKKTIFDINNEYRKNMDTALTNKQYSEHFDILQIHTNIFKATLSFLIHKCNFSSDEKTLFINNVINKSKPVFDKISNLKCSKNIFNIIIIFIEQLNKEIESEKYIEIIELFLKKLQKGKIFEIKLLEKLYHPEFDEKLEGTSEKFISWLVL